MPIKVPDCTPDGRFCIDTSDAGRLGEGAFGVCCLGFHTITQKPVAIKISKRMDVAMLEAIVQKRLKHPNVVQLHSAQVSMNEPGVSYLVMECCTGGELFNLIAEQGALHPDAAFRIFHEIISGLAYCHESGVYHRDLKPENILLSHNGHARIADFGLAILGQEQGELVSAYGQCGSSYYMAPEVINQQPGGYDPAAADIWSLGIIYYTMLTGCAPWLKASRSCSAFLYFCNHGLRLPSFVPEGVAEIVCRMLDVNTIARATAREVECMAQHLRAAHPLHSLKPNVSKTKSSCGSHLFDAGIDIPGKVTIADVEYFCLDRTQTLLGDRHTGICSLFTPWQTPLDTLPSPTTGRLSLSPNRRSTAPDPLPSLAAPLQIVPCLGEPDGRQYGGLQSPFTQASPNDRPRRWTTALYEASIMRLPWQLSEDSRTSQTTSASGSCDWNQGERSSRQGNDSSELPQAAVHQLAKQKQKPTPTEQKMSDGTEKARQVSSRKSAEEEEMIVLPRFASQGEGVGFSNRGTGSAWLKGSCSSTSLSSSSCCQIKDNSRSFADLGAMEELQNRRSSTVAWAKHHVSNPLFLIAESETLPAPSLTVKADGLPELQSPAESPTSNRALLENLRSHVAESLSGSLEVWELHDLAKPFVLQAPPYPEPCGLRRSAAVAAGASLPPKYPLYTDRKLQEKAKGGPETCVKPQMRRLIGSAGGVCIHHESGSGTCARCQEGREATATGTGRRRRSRSPSPCGYGVSEATHMVVNADSLCCVSLPDGARRQGLARQQKGKWELRSLGWKCWQWHGVACVSHKWKGQDSSKKPNMADEAKKIQETNSCPKDVFAACIGSPHYLRS